MRQTRLNAKGSETLGESKLDLGPHLSIAPFFPISREVAVKMLSLAGLCSDDLVCDLGCGTGEILVTAAQNFGAKAVGVELDRRLYKKAMYRIRKRQLDDRVKVIHNDLFRFNLGDADVVTLYLTDDANAKVKPKLDWELKKGAKVVSHDFKVPGWMPSKIEFIDKRLRLMSPEGILYLYRYPQCQNSY
ncbi:MAG: class I SAM-dependent methyltransferase [Candidatus Bathyarchaeota archaeon]